MSLRKLSSLQNLQVVFFDPGAFSCPLTLSLFLSRQNLIIHNDQLKYPKTHLVRYFRQPTNSLIGLHQCQRYSQYLSKPIFSYMQVFIPDMLCTTDIPAGNYMSKVNNRNSRTRCEICSKLKIKTPERRQWHSGVFIVNFEHISLLVLVFLLLTLSR